MTTKLLLIQDVEKLGRSGDIVTTKPGYARNYLLPQGLAVVADKRAIRMQAELQKKREEQAAADRAEAEKLAEQLKDLVISLEVKVDEEGHMYGSVSAPDLIEKIKAEKGIELEKKNLPLKHPIKKTGVHPVTIRLKEEVTCDITAKVIPEGAEATEE